jgi:hypothetical protein
MRWSVALAFGAAGASLFALLAACNQGGAPPETAAQGSRDVPLTRADDHSRCDYKGRSDREVTETAGPGAIQPNIRRVYAIVGQGDDRHKILICREVDTNLDGIKDVVRTYNAKGEPLHELADTNYDGRIDTWITFAHGRMLKEELDTNHDGKPDEVRYYVQGKLSRVQRDTNHDGKPDVWEIYDKGHLQRMGVDLNHDGHVDRWDRDEIAEREEERKEAAEEEKADKQKAAEAGAPAPASSADAGAPAAKSTKKPEKKPAASKNKKKKAP